MTKKTDSAAPQTAKADLATLYRPLGLKAVLAAALMSKKAPLKKLA